VTEVTERGLVDSIVKIGIDIGGVISKYPKVFRSIIHVLRMAELDDLYDHVVQVYIVSDMKPHTKAVAFCHDNGIDIPADRIICADFSKHGEACKRIISTQHNLDMMIDDFPGYVAEGAHARLLVMPNTEIPYYHDSFVTDGSEGNFGRRRNHCKEESK